LGKPAHLRCRILHLICIQRGIYGVIRTSTFLEPRGPGWSYKLEVAGVPSKHAIPLQRPDEVFFSRLCLVNCDIAFNTKECDNR